MTDGEKAFLDQYTRKLMVDLCYGSMIRGSLEAGIGARRLAESEPFLAYAREKGWVSKKGDKILSEGWKTAARFLKR